MRDNLTVREVLPWDAPWLFKITSDPKAVRYMGLSVHQTVHDAYRLIEQYRLSQSTFLAIVDRSFPGELLGVVGYEVQGHSVAMTVKLNLHDRRVYGAARTVCVPFVKELLAQPPIWRVWAYCHVDNMPVQRVLQRMGATCEGVMQRYAVFPNISTEPQDCKLYSIVKGKRT